MSIFYHTDWLTISAAIHTHNIPAEHIEDAILSERIECRRVCGARVVRRSEVAALALTLRAGLCEGCADD